MFIDASAIVAIISNEEDAGYLVAKLEAYKKPVFYSAVSAFEAVVSLAKIIALSKGLRDKPIPAEVMQAAQGHVDRFLESIGARPMTIDGKTYQTALEVAARYGRYVGHPARLNMGDCFAYACSRQYRIPLLFKGKDFTETDIETV